MTARGYDRDFAENCFGQIEGLRRIRLSRKPRGELRAFGLCLGVDQNAATWTCSAPPSSTASRWAFISRRSSCATRARTASRSAPSTSIPAIGIAHWSRRPLPYGPASGGGITVGRAVRLGFRLVHGLSEDELEAGYMRAAMVLVSIERLAAVSGSSRFSIERLAEADAFRSMGLDRRAALRDRAAARRDRPQTSSSESSS